MKIRDWVLLAASWHVADAFLSPVRQAAKTTLQMTTTVADAPREQSKNDPFISSLYLYSKEGTTEAAHKARDMLKKLKDDGHDLTVKHYTIVMDAFGRIGEPENAEKVCESMTFEPSQVTRNVLLLAHVRARNIARAEHWLQTMGQEAAVSDYNIMLSAYAKEADAHSAERLIKIMVDRCKKEGKKCPCEPNLVSYNHLLDAYAKRKGSSERAMEILSVMEQQGKVDARTFAAVVHCLLQDNRPEFTMQKAEQFYHIAKEKGFFKDLDRLHVALLDTYVAVAESSSSDAANRTTVAEKAHALLPEMEGAAKVIAYNKVLKVWKLAGTADSVVRAEVILQQMREQNVADRYSYTTLMGIYANRGDAQSAQKANKLLDSMIQNGGDLNTQTYNNLILAWARSGDLRRAEQVLDTMERSKIPSIVPNVVTYSTLMDGWCKSKDQNAALKCEAMFKRMQQSFLAGNVSARPNLISYVTLINAHSASSEKGSAQRAQDVLFEVLEEYKRGNTELKPTVKIVSLVIGAWQKSGERDAGEHAEALLNWMIAAYQNHQDESLRPNEYVFSLTISAWSKSRKVGKMIRARQVLDKMIILKGQGVIKVLPNTHCYNAVINS